MESGNEQQGARKKQQLTLRQTLRLTDDRYGGGISQEAEGNEKDKRNRKGGGQQPEGSFKEQKRGDRGGKWGD